MAGEMSPHATLIDLLSARAEREPEKIGFIFLADGKEKERISYGALHRRACAVGGYLQASAVAGERALLLLPSGLDFVVSFFAALYAGMIAVPAYPPGARVDGKSRRLESIARDARPSRVLTTAQIASRLRGEAEGLLGPAEPVDPGGIEDVWAERWRRPATTAESIAFLQYTSGSTAQPKGVIVSHGNILCNERMIQAQFGQSAESTVVSWLPQYHDMGLIGGLLQPLYNGSLGVFMSPSAFLQQPIGWLRAISHYQAHTSGGPNFSYDLVVATTTEEQRQGLDLRSWRVAFTGAEPVKLATIDRFSEAFAPHGFSRDAFFPCYGLAEATLMVTGRQGVRILPGESGSAHGCLAARRPLVSCGTPVVETQVVIVDPITTAPCRAGEIGEIWVQGPSVASGYWQQEEASVQTFGAAAPGQRGRFLRTGDLGSLVDGELMVAGRLKDLIIFHGENYYPEDLELTASDCHAAVRFQPGAAFMAEIDGGEELVVLHGVHRASHDGLEEVAQAVRDAISQHHGVRVHTVVLVHAAAIPRTSSGKVQRHLCRTQFEAGTLPALLTHAIGSRDQGEAAAPATLDPAMRDEDAREAALHHEVATAMRLDPAQLSPDRPLTAWGLDSIVATELHHKLLQRFDTDIPISRLLDGMTLKDVRAAVAAAASETEGKAQRPAGTDRCDTATDRAKGTIQISAEQERLWMLSQISPHKAAYNVSAGLPIEGPLQRDRLRRAVEEVVRRQEMLRATFSSTPAGPVLNIAASCDVTWTEQEMASGAAPSIEARDQETCRAGLRHAEAPFDLQRGPLIRFHLLAFGAADFVLLVCAHHLIMDAESFRLLWVEIADVYRTLASGQPASFAATPPGIAHEASPPAGARIADHLAYWRGQLAELPAPLDLSGGHSAMTKTGGAVGMLRFSIADRTTAGLRELGRRRASTLFMLLQSGWDAAFHRWTGRREWLSATPVSGRSGQAQRGVIGSFAYPLLLRANVSGDMALSTLIETTRARLLQAYDHQDIEFTRVIESLRGQGRSSRSPLVQVLFSVIRLPDDTPTLDAVVFRTPRLIRTTTDVELFVTLEERFDVLHGTVFYQSDLIDSARVQQLVDGFAAMLDALVHHPERTVAEVGWPAVTRDTAVGEPATLRICVAASFVADPLAEILGFWSSTLRTPWAITIAPPGQIMQVLLDPTSALARNTDGVNILLVQPHSGGLDATRTLDAVSAFQRRSSTPLIVALCPERTASAEDVSSWHQRLAEMPGVHAIGADEWLGCYPVETVHDAFAERIANLPFSDDFYVAAGTGLSRSIRALTARPYKVLALDCDHTLWQGVCAEDGPDQVRVDGPHAFLQQFALAQQRSGMLLCLVSKNSEADVLATFAAHPSMPLSLDDFVAKRINWLPKSENLASLANELGLDLDSFVYLDDNPLECAEVESQCPAVLTLCLQQADDIPRLLRNVWAFDRGVSTAEDVRKTELYRQDAARRALTDQPTTGQPLTSRLPQTMEGFIAGLELTIDITPVLPEELARVAQLSSRVNQFNVSMRRYTEAELARRVADHSAECLVARVRDRFGDYGLVGAVVLHPMEQALGVEGFFLSCRALGRGVEDRLLNEVGKRAVGRGLPYVGIDLQRAPRNTPAQEFLASVGATMPSDLDGRTTVMLDGLFASEVSYRERAMTSGPADSGPARIATRPRGGDPSSLAQIATGLRTVGEIAEAQHASRARRTSGRDGDGVDAAAVAPTTDIEIALARIWEDIIGVPVADVSLDLFALGGDSLLAVRILARMRETFQIELSLDDLFLGPLTVQGVAAAVERAMVSPVAPSIF